MDKGVTVIILKKALFKIDYNDYCVLVSRFKRNRNKFN